MRAECSEEGGVSTIGLGVVVVVGSGRDKVEGSVIYEGGKSSVREEGRCIKKNGIWHNRVDAMEMRKHENGVESFQGLE